MGRGVNKRIIKPLVSMIKKFGGHWVKMKNVTGKTTFLCPEMELAKERIFSCNNIALTVSCRGLNDRKVLG